MLIHTSYKKPENTEDRFKSLS